VIEERIRRARPEEIISAIPSGAFTQSVSRGEERLPDKAPFPEWLHIEVPESVEAGKPVEAVEEMEPAWDAEKKGEEGRMMVNPMEIISAGGEVMADDLIEALTGRLDDEVFEALKDAVLSGRLRITAVKDAVWSPIWVRAVARVLEREGAAAILGADTYVRRRVAEWLGLVEQEATGRQYTVIEDAYEGDVEAAAARISGSSMVILGENVRPEAVRAYGYASRLLGCRLVKLGDGPLPPARIQSPSTEELAAYMAVKAAAMGLMDRIGLDEVMDVAAIASMSRSYMTVDDYLGELSKGPVDLEAFKRAESGRLFDRFEQLAVAVWRATGSVSDAVTHYSNILAQMDPANMEVKLRIFGEKLVKMAGRQQKPPRRRNPRPVDDAGKLTRDLGTLRGERHEGD
jgi:hypothetical protein